MRETRGPERARGATSVPNGPPVPGPGRQEPARLGSALEFLRLLWATDHALQTMSRRMERTIGVSGPQRFVVRMVGKSPGISPSELAKALHVDRSSVTPLLKRLSSLKLLRRRPDPADGRRATLWLTSRGRRIDRFSAGTIEAVVKGVLSGNSRRRIAGVRAVLTALEAALRTSPDGTGRTRAGRRTQRGPGRGTAS